MLEILGPFVETFFTKVCFNVGDEQSRRLETAGKYGWKTKKIAIPRIQKNLIPE
jgi:hypothetical protein